MIASDAKAEHLVFVIRLSAIGDTIITAWALRKLRLNGYEPVLVTFPGQKDIGRSMPHLNKLVLANKDGTFELLERELTLGVFPLPKETQSPKGNTLQSLWAAKKVSILDLQKTSRSARCRSNILKELARTGQSAEECLSVSKRTLYRFFLLVWAWISFSQKGRSQGIQKENIFNIQKLQDQLIEKFLAKQGSTQPANIKIENIPLLQPAECAKAEKELIPSHPYIAVFPGASGFIKTWPKERFRKLIELTLKKTQLEIVICGGEDEKTVGNYLQFSERTRIHNLAGKISLACTLKVIEGAKHIVTNDSFAGHAAHSLGKSASIIYGPTSPLFGFLPEAPNVTAHYANLKCSPCTRHGKSPCRFKNLTCMQQINADDIFKDYSL
jgi:ADP-heptose:LPS heptosyltransferase